MNVSKYLLLIFSFVLFVPQVFRSYILFWGWNKLGRMPRFEDSLEILKPIFIGWQEDEILLVALHFLLPILMIIILLLFVRVLNKGNYGRWLTFPIIIFFYEILFRLSPSYDYVMFD